MTLWTCRRTMASAAAGIGSLLAAAAVASGRTPPAQGDPTRFPSGRKALGDYIHAKGLKFGICRLIAINQDALGLQAARVTGDANQRILAKRLSNDDVAVALFNQSGSTRTISTAAAAARLDHRRLPGHPHRQHRGTRGGRAERRHLHHRLTRPGRPPRRPALPVPRKP
jgi:alpha galactosidase A-like protein